MRRISLLAVALGACHGGGGATKPTAGSGSGTATTPTDPGAPADVMLADTGIQNSNRGGALVGETSRITLVALRTALPGFEVTPVPMMNTTVYRVSQKGTALYEIVPNTDGSILSIDGIGKAVHNAPHGWRVGDNFADMKSIESCGCWTSPEGKDHAACFKFNEKVAVVFDRECDIADLATVDPPLVGQPIKWMVWEPNPWQVQ